MCMKNTHNPRLLRRFLVITAGMALLTAACGGSSDSLDAGNDDGTQTTAPSDQGDNDGEDTVDRDLPLEVPFADGDGELIGSANMGGRVVDPKPSVIDGIAIAESYPEQILVEFTAGAEGCTAANASAWAMDDQVVITLEVGITADALTKSCLAGEFVHTLNIPLDEGLDGRDVVVGDLAGLGVIPPEEGAQDVPPLQSFETTLVGLGEESAVDAIEAQGLLVRISERDGEAFALTADYSEDRINLVINDGVVTRATIG